MAEQSFRQNWQDIKILHIPVNWASRMYHQHQALQRNGVDSRGVAFHCFPSQKPNGLYVHSDRFRRFFGKPFTHKLMRALFLTKVLREAQTCNYVHWYGGERLLSLSFDLKLIDLLGNKKRFVQWQGSDIRDPIMECDINPYYRKATEHVSTKEKKRISRACKEKQKLFREHGFHPLASVDLESYLIDEVKQEGWYSIRHAIDCDRLNRQLNKDVLAFFNSAMHEQISSIAHGSVASGGPSWPADPVFQQILKPIKARAGARIRIGHSPSKKSIKGTFGIEEIISRLEKEYSIELVVLHGLAREEALKRVAECDIFIDQMVLGMYGAAALEAMAMGVPTICYLSDANRRRLPAELPIINATLETLGDVLVGLIRNKEKLNDIGFMSHKYVNSMHSYSAISELLISIYTGQEKVITSSTYRNAASSGRSATDSPYSKQYL